MDMTTEVGENLLTAQQVAALLNVPDSWVYAAAREGTLPSVPNMGRYVRFRPEDVAAFRSAQRQEDQ